MNVDLLEQLLSTPRGHGSVGEIATARVLVKQFGFQEYQDDKKEALAYVRRVKGRDSVFKTNILWSCHIDTVHAVDAGKVQKINFDAKEFMYVSGDGKNPLGADNSAGMWMLLEMIEAGVPGTYVFHRGEERGGIGSDGMQQWWAKEIEGHTHAIAFDRRGTDDIITHQWGGRCCSEKFALQYAELLNTDKNPDTFMYSPSKLGSFTDTANYTHLIPECTNTSVGYESEHGPHESLDLGHLFRLRNKVIEVFKELPVELIVERKVTDKDDDRYSSWGGYSWGRGLSNDFDYTPKDKQSKKKIYDADPATLSEDDIVQMDWSDLRAEIKDDPGGYADLLMRLAEELVFQRDIDYDGASEGGGPMTADEARALGDEQLALDDEYRPGYDG